MPAGICYYAHTTCRSQVWNRAGYGSTNIVVSDELPAAFELSAHAARMLEERAIPLEWVRRVIDEPQWSEADRHDPQLRHALGRIAEHENRVLRVVYNEATTPRRIVTVYLDRTQRNRT